MSTDPRSGADRPLRTATGSRITARGRRTRARILDAALASLAESGYDGMSMRDIARRADVSLGNAYYYFPSKARLVATFYEEKLRELFGLAEPILARERTLEGRLRGVLEAWIALIEPFHDAAGALLRTAADPGAALRSGAPGPRGEAVGFYRELVSGSSTPIPEEIRLELPGLLWAAHAGLTLFWIRDDSFRRRRTRALVDRGPGLLTRAVAFARLPGFGDLRRQLRDLLRDLA